MKNYLKPLLTAIGGMLLFSFTVSAQSGSLKVTSFPSGANVIIDNVDTGKTTPMSTSLPVGDHKVVVTIPNSGWNPDTRIVTIVSGNNDLSVTLLPILTTGPKGDKGDKGEKGDTGAKGETGAKGDTGETGPKGDTGATGASGPAGPQGPAGPGGFNGIAEFSDSAASGTWTAPPNITHVMVQMWGGGGGGGVYPGGGGGYSRSVIEVTPGATYDIIVGFGGVGFDLLHGTSSQPGQDSKMKLHGNGLTLIFAGGGGAGSVDLTGGPGDGGDLDPSAAISHKGFGGNLADNAAFAANLSGSHDGDHTGHGGAAGGGGANGYVLLLW